MSDIDVVDEEEYSFIDGEGLAESVEEPHAEAPPKRGRGRPRKVKTESGKSDTQPDPSKSETKTKPGPGRPRKLPSLEKQIAGILEVGVDVWAVRDPFCAEVAREQAGKIARDLDEIAMASPRLHEALAGAAKGSGPLKLFIDTMPIAIAVFAHHNPRAVAARQAYEQGYQPPPDMGDVNTDFDPNEPVNFEGDPAYGPGTDDIWGPAEVPSPNGFVAPGYAQNV